ncbi:MAG: hypothetical protein EOO00_04945 [Chitinophagaceae bacterium]|nr:MAG: hypothetical protein EOO00_04945 [Chitinophagaceae bacterium]
MNRHSLAGQILLADWIVSEEQDGTLIVRDPDIPSGSGFRLTLNESTMYYQAKVEFEDFASELIERTDRQISTGAPDWLAGLLSNDRYLKCKIFRRSIEVNFGERQSDGLWLQFERKKTESFTTVNFIDYVVSFIYFLFPYQIEGEEEGAEVTGLESRYERSSMNRAICLAYHGYKCKACKTDLQAIYGEVARDFIHVHHLNPLATTGHSRPDPVKDLVPLCPNCHGIAHLQNPPFTVQEIQNMIAQNNAEIYTQ